jgi:hypothetical protein
MQQQNKVSLFSIDGRLSTTKRIQRNLQVEEVNGSANICVRQFNIVVAQVGCRDEFFGVCTVLKHRKYVIDVSHIEDRFEAQVIRCR